jgi:hypothetical protein
MDGIILVTDMSNQELAWFFMMGYDMLEYWDGRDIAIVPGESTLRCIQVE